MSEKKKFILNCDVCDARKIKEESLSEYEQIIINADLILVVKDGRIAEQGSHEELMRKRGEYFQMQQARFEGAFE